jgi:phospholipase/lecithinase/hemolysin
MFRLTNLTRVAAIGAVVALAACESKKDVLGPNPLPTGALFQSYVALGNSITAGYQSGGINDSTQRQSYARLLAGQMGTQYHYASLNMPGCPAPVANFLTQARVLTGVPTGTTLQACYLRASSSITDVLNNVAVPGATSYDPDSLSTGASNGLTTFILGGKTQVQRALIAVPTFATIWIGNNDVLAAGASGILVNTPALGQLGILSTPPQFKTNYDAMIKQLLDSAPALKGVLIGVVQVGGIPLLSSGDTISKANAANRAVMNAIAGTPVAVDPNCVGSTSLVNVPSLLAAVRAGQHPAVISCAKGTYPAPVGDIFVLDPAEQQFLGGVIAADNTYIANKAASIGFAYLDPNPLLASLRATNAIPRFPNFQSGTTTFGALISLDGIHPAAPAHQAIANALIDVINTTYSTTLQHVP